jgi:hypothetical protein
MSVVNFIERGTWVARIAPLFVAAEMTRLKFFGKSSDIRIDVSLLTSAATNSEIAI